MGASNIAGWRERAWWSSSIVLSAFFTGLVFAATMIQVQTPITRGYVNLGDAMIFVASFVGGPLTGFIAGGIGSALADIISGYGYYAPGTFIIKGFEGFLAGWLYGKLASLAERGRYREAVLGVAGLVFALTLGLGSLYSYKYGGYTVLMIGGHRFSFTVSYRFWVIAGVILAGVILLGSIRGSGMGSAITAWIVAGLWMVLGYFLYEATVVYSLGRLEGSSPLAAASEIPANIGQALAGVIVASFIAGVIKRAMGE